MNKTAFLFPGQGSQEVGMGRELFKSDPFLRSLIQLGSDLAGQDLEKVCLKGPDTLLRQARLLQPVLAAVCLSFHKCVADRGIRADVILGHSLGEITSLAAAGVVSPEDCIRIAAKRGELMEQTASRVKGGMLAALFVPMETVLSLMASMNAPRRIVLANDNADDQIVLSGDLELLELFAKKVSEGRLGRTAKLPVAGPWHSPFMNDARAEFESWVASVPFAAPSTPLMLNATACIESDPEQIRRRISGQLTNPVYWRQCMKSLKQMGIDTMLEIGPNRILSGLARVNGFRTDTRIFNINTMQGLEKAVVETACTTAPACV